MPERESPARRLARRWFAGGGAAEPERGDAFAGTGLAALAALERAAGARLVAGPGLAARAELAAAERGGLATALGLALGGERVAVFLTGAELAAAAPVQAEALRLRAPLVVYLVGALECARGAAVSGAAVLVPFSVAEAVDLALVARRFAEESLALALLVLDGPRLAFAVQEAWLPTPDTLARRLGGPADDVHPVTPAQQTLFGRHRRRVPRLHDAGRPARLGGEAGPLAGAPARAAAEVLFAAEAAARFERLAAEMAAATGRPLPALSGRRLSRADVGVVACGPLAETAATLAEPLRAAGVRVAVFGVHRLSPFPAEDLAELAGSCARVAVLERLDEPVRRGALATAVRAVLAASEHRPELVTIVVPGEEAPLGVRDLAAAFRALSKGTTRRVVLGLAPGAGDDEYPKRRALHDALLREHPEIETLAVHAGDFEPIEARPQGSVTVALAGSGPDALGGDAARLILGALGGHLRSRLAVPARAAGAPAVERVTWSPVPLAAPADDAPVELVIALEGALPAGLEPAPGGTLVVPAPAPPLAPALARRAAAGDLELLELDRPQGGEALVRECWLGALAAALSRRSGVEIKLRQLRAVREGALIEVPIEAREARLEALAAGFESLRAVASPAVEASAPPAAPPVALLRGLALARSEAALGDAARFRDLAGLLIAEGHGERILPDPTLVSLALPAFSAPERAHAARLPGLDPAPCTACGACWSGCPHGAIEARVLAPAALVEHAIGRAARRERGAEALRRFAGKLGARLATATAEARGGVAGELLESAAETLFAEAGLAGDRLAQARAALAAVRAEIGALPLVASAVFLGEPEAAARGTGELLALALDPDRCTGCGLCVAACAPGALADATATGGAVAAGRAAAAAVAALPASSAATIARARADARVGPLAGALLSPVAERPLAGFDAAPAGSAPRLAARQALALAAFHLEAGRAGAVARVDELAGRLGREVHESLSRAVPDGDLAALARGLDDVELPSADLAEVAGRLAGAVESARVDIPRLRRLVESARAMADLGERLRGAESGSERAPLSVVVGPGAALAWARRFPDNPFGVPATVADASPLGLARGLALAEAARAVAEARAMRRAALELERPAEAAHAANAPLELGWRDLDPEERALATTVVALVDETAGEPELAEALDILSAGLPVAIVALAPAPGAALSPWAALAFAAPSGVVAHATVAQAQPLDEAAAALATSRGGALVRVLAPMPAVAGETPVEILIRTRGVAEAREFPLGCRVAAVHPANAAPRVDPSAEAAEAERRHAAELAAAAASHREELAQLEAEVRARLAARARQRLLELAARARSGGGSAPEAT